MAIVQKLHAQDWENRVNCCQRVLANVPPTAIPLTVDETHFHLTMHLTRVAISPVFDDLYIYLFIYLYIYPADHVHDMGFA